MNDKQMDDENIFLIFEKLNWWVEQTYNPKTGEIESTGEAQAAINNYLKLLDSMHVRYAFEKGKYIFQNN